MKTIGDKLREARLNKGLKQAEVAEKLNCAATSLTNWEKGKVNPSLDVLSNLCEVYDIAPLSLLDKKYSFEDLVNISSKPVSERTYEEEIALNFSRPILAGLLDKDAQKRQNEQVEKTAEFIQQTNVLNRFGGMMGRAEIEPIQAEYEKNGGADADILFAFHSLTKENKAAFLSMLSGLIADGDNLQDFNGKMDKAQDFTLSKLSAMRKALQNTETMDDDSKKGD